MRPILVLAVTTLLCIEPACSAVTSAEGVSGHSILFVGNSLTYTNDLPSMVEQIARAAGDSVRVGMVAGANLAVIDHTGGDTDALAKIHEGHWAFVVLQQGPTPAGIVVLGHAAPLIGPETVFFRTGLEMTEWSATGATAGTPGRAYTPRL